MSSSDTLTYDQTPSHRPVLSELGGGAKVNAQPEPDPVRQFRAEDCNQMAKQLAALARVAPIAILQVDESGGVYTKVAVSGQPTAAILSAFSVIRNSAGNITVSWTAGIFPAPIARPRVNLLGSTPLITAVEVLSNVSCRLHFATHAGAATDASFDLEIY